MGAEGSGVEDGPVHPNAMRTAGVPPAAIGSIGPVGRADEGSMSNERPTESHRDPARSSGPIRSEFADDRDMIELVRSFVDEMDARIKAIEGAATEGDAERMATVAHQLKGAAGGYGFPIVSEVAWGLERALRHEGQDLADLRGQIDELLAVCRRVSR